MVIFGNGWVWLHAFPLPLAVGMIMNHGNSRILLSNMPIFFGCVRKIVKYDSIIVRGMSVHPHGTTRLPPGGFS